MKKFLLLSLLAWTLAFRVPSGGAAVDRLRRLPLRSTTAPNEQQFEPPPRQPTHVPSLIDLLPPAGSFPTEAYDTAKVLTVVYLSVRVAGVELSDAVNLAGFAVALATIYGVVDKRRNEPDCRVREALEKPYDPPQSKPWTGTNFGEKEVLEFVDKNELRKTLVFVDPSGNAKPDLLDDIFRGEIHVVAPTMKKLSLDEDLGKEFDLKETKGLGVLAGLIKNGIKFPFGSALLPAKLLVNLAFVDDNSKLGSVIREVVLLKQAAGANVVTIVTVANGTFVGDLPQSLQSALQVLS